MGIPPDRDIPARVSAEKSVRSLKIVNKLIIEGD
jgi:hypothetical protein